MAQAPFLPHLPPANRIRGRVFRFFAAIWRWLNFGRRLLLNALFALLLVGVGFAVFSGGSPKLKEKTVLVLNWSGPLVEQRSGGAKDRLLKMGQGADTAQTQLRDVIAGLEAAAKDDKIGSALLKVDDLGGGGLVLLREAASAIERFKASGKKVVAWGANYDQAAYYVAAHANEVYVHPMGTVMMTGYGRTRNYYKDAFDRAGVSANVVRVGKYKNAAEPYFSNAPSAATLESEAYLFGDLWATYTEGIEKARKLPAGSIAKGIDAIPENLAAAGGDIAKLALNTKLVDGLKTQDELRAMLVERGAASDDKKTFRQVNFDEYLASLPAPATGDGVAVVVAEGGIGDGNSPSGSIGGRSTAELIRKARDDKTVKALVLRVNSPGGSAFGSELIRRELELTRTAGKPVVVSMGHLAASGGYWISLAADQIMADPATITGSIGVFGMLPSASGLMDKLSIKTGGYHSTWLGAAGDPRLPMSEKFQSVVQLATNRIYDDFLAKVAAARKTTPQKVDDVAQGRVWTGQQAKARGLVDKLGSYGDALASARVFGKLPADAPIRYIEKDAGRLDALAKSLGAEALAAHAAQWVTGLTAQMGWIQVLGHEAIAVPSVAAEAAHELAWMAEFSDRAKKGLPFMAVVHCLCEVP